MSVGELAMTRRISPVATCCSSALPSSSVRACTSSNRRTFSIAITAWSANCFSSSSWAFGTGPASAQPTTMTPSGSPWRSIGTPSMRRQPMAAGNR